MKSKYLMIGAAVCAVLFLFSGIMLCRQYADEKQSAEAFEQVAALVETEPAPTDTPQETEPLPELTAFEKYRAVQEQNSDFVGWLSVPGTNIDYPVMQTVGEPNYYLKRGFDKQYSDYGVPYVQENCDLALSDNCVIYGHHMNNGTMFADLCKYESEGFYQEHKAIRFDTLSGFGEYEIVAVFKTIAYSEQGFKYYHFTRAESAEDFDTYIAQCKALSLYDTGVTVEYGDKLITLSTCEYSRKTGAWSLSPRGSPHPLRRWAAMKPEKYVVSLSGGKDSTAMLLRLLEEKRPVDLILFCDTGLEFPQMYEHLARLEAYIGRPIIRLKAEHDFEYYFLHYTPKRKNPALEQYSGMSWAGPRNRWCTGILKTRVVDAYLKELREHYTVIEYVGIAADEPKRIKDKTYLLAEWGMTEKDCLAYCYERGFDWGGLYEIFHRVSCWCCPLQSLDELRKLHRHFPDLWRQLETWDDATWRTFIKGYSARDLAARFDFEEQWQKAGGNIRSRAFYAAMREEIQRCRTEVKPCLTSKREMWSRER